MKLGISTYTYTWAIGVPGQAAEQPMRAPDLLRQAAALGLHLVQIADNLPLDRLSPAELDALQALAGELDIQIEVGTRGIEPEHLRRYLGLARRFGSPILRVVVDTPTQRPSAEEALATLAPLRAEFEAAGVTLAIENHDRFQTADLAKIVRALGSSWVGICLDTVNSFGALEGPQVVVDALAELTVNLHVKDFTIFRAGHMMGFSVEGRPAGQGRLDIPWLLERLRANGHDCSAILELWTPPEPGLAATIAKEKLWAEQSIGYLRGIIG